MKTYPSLTGNTLENAITVLREITRLRNQDITDFDNLQNRFWAGRKVGKIPSGSTDVAATDKLGDFNYNDSYLYLLTESTSGAVWRRATLGSF